MFDPKAPSSVLALAEYKKPLVQRLLIKLAWQRAKHEQDAEDLLSSSLVPGSTRTTCPGARGAVRLPGPILRQVVGARRGADGARLVSS
jgi:hypothetical protein